MPVATMLAALARNSRSMRKWRRRSAEGTAVMPASGMVRAITAMAPDADGDPSSRGE